MKYKSVLFILFSMIILVGCQIDQKSVEKQKTEEIVTPKDMAIEDLPDVRAFQDEFTRGFLQSTEETRPGYYPFLSGTGAFEMDFPAEGKLGERSYNIRNESFEALMIGVGNEESNLTHIIRITYYGHLQEELHKDSRLGRLQTSVEGELDFNRIEDDNEVYYIATYESDNKGFDFITYGYTAFIFNKNTSGGIEVAYTTDCEDGCSDLKEVDKESALEWIRSLQFSKIVVESDQDEG